MRHPFSVRAGTRLAGCLAAAAGALALVAPASSPAANYVAMGDSYSSGTGTRDYYDAACERSDFSYSGLIDGQIPGTSFLAACGGAKTEDVDLNGQSGKPRQIDGLSSDTQYVTMSIGGNDAGFTDVLLECGQPAFYGADCNEAVDTAQDTIRNVLPGRLDRVYRAIRARSGSARVTIVGYPRIFNGEDCNAATFFSEGEMTRLNQTADLLADTTRARAQAHGFGFADSRGAFLGHATCDDVEWLNGLSNPTGESYHPNKLGHSNGYAGIVRAALLAQASPASAPGANGRIAFARGTAGAEDVYAVNGNGTFPVNLTPGQPLSDVDPAFSPDGTKIAFASDRDGDYDVYTASADGTGVTQLTNSVGEDLEPTWSPNGAYIAFRSARDGDNEIFKMTAAGGSQTQLTSNTQSDFAPAWSPDGAEIAWQKYDGANNDIYKMNADGQGQTRLTTSTASDGAPSYSPDGATIAFHSNRDGDFEIHTMTATGGSQTQRTSNTASDQQPAYSPNGALIVFDSTRDGNAEIYTMSATGSSQTRRTTDGATDVKPSYQADGAAPETSIAGPSGTINTATPSFTLTTTEAGSAFECSIDQAAFSACPASYQAPELADGNHSLRARAIDPSGNVDATPASRVFTVDTTPAGTAITSGPSGTATNDPTPTFEFGAADAQTTFACAIDDAEPAPCAISFRSSELADGSHRFTVTGTDSVGNEDEASALFTVDTVAPVSEITTAPGSVTGERRPSFEFGSSESGSTFECRLDPSDDGGWIDCTSPFVVPADLADGPHAFEVRATDPAGNLSAAADRVDFTVDTVAPSARIDAPEPASPTTDGTPEFNFSSSDPDVDHFECRVDSLDDADWAVCSSPYETAPLGDGTHSFGVRAVDLAGNAGEPVERSLVVDVSVPESSLSGDPAEGSVTNESPAFHFSSDDPDATFECRFDPPAEDTATGWQPCEPGAPVPAPGSTEEDPKQIVLAGGPHVFEVRAVDQVGHRDESPARRNFTVDDVDPDTAITDSPDSPTNDSTISFSFESPDDEGAHFECRIGDAAFAPCTSGAAVTAPAADGVYGFDVRAVDGVGNRDETPAQDTFRIDRTNPVATISGPERTNDRTPTFALSANEPASFQCRLDSVDRGTCPPSYTTPELSGEGDHTLKVIATDEAGNTAASISKTFILDLRPADTRLTAGPESGQTIAQRSPTFEFDTTQPPSEPAPTFECRVDDRGFQSCGSPHQVAPLDDGEHRFEVRSIDAAGNVDPTPASRTFTVAVPFTRPDPEPPSNEFKLSKPDRDRKRGTAIVVAEVPGPGTLVLRGKGIRVARSAPTSASSIELEIEAKGRAARRLRRTGRLQVDAEVRYAPTGGEARTKQLSVKLVRKQRRR